MSGAPSAALADYLPIAEHGIIGDLHSIALVGTDGRIDWYCCPRFDSPSVFGAILDKERGGFYRIAPTMDEWVPKQLYLPDTNVLITRFLTPGGVGEIQDFMPIARGAAAHRHRLIRRVLGVRGEMRFHVDVQPRFDYGREGHDTIFHEKGVLFRSPSLSLALETAVPMRFHENGAHGEFTLLPGETAAFVLEQVPESYVPRSFREDEIREAFEHTVEYWRRWLGQSRYRGRWRETVHRSALTLKLLTYAPTGAIVAAPTTSLPEQIAFMNFLTGHISRAGSGPSGPLQIMYGIDGRTELPERELNHLEGYRGSAPVRVGNGAVDQLQLDIYGALIDSIYLYDKWGQPISSDHWDEVCAWWTGCATTGTSPTRGSG